MTEYPQVPIIVLDQDWAPDFVTAEVMGLLEKHNVKSTWFITHKSDILRSLEKNPHLYELGIHPNFLPGSTHGATTAEVLAHCLNIVPQAKCMRTHAYAQSSMMYAHVAEHTEIQIDASVFTPHTPNLTPFEYWIGNRPITRIPVIWEDDNEMKIPGSSWNFEDNLLLVNGLKVFAFHPIHVYLNTPSLSTYQTFKQGFSNLMSAEKEQAENFKQDDQPGVRDFFLAVLKHISAQNHSFKLSEIATPSKGS